MFRGGILTAGRAAVVSLLMRLRDTSRGARRGLAYVAIARGTADASMGQVTLFRRPASPPFGHAQHVAALPRQRLIMPVLTTLLAGACALFVLVLVTMQRRTCPPGEHLVTVVGARRLRHALGKRYWIRCLLCDVNVGPYDSWHVAWAEAFRLRLETRRGVSGDRPTRLPSNEITR
jgi:hypothetical protein